MKYDLVGIGNALLDFQVEVPDTALEKMNIKKGSMTLVEAGAQLQTLTRLREELNISDFEVSSGGSAVNTLAGFANFGGKTFLIAKMGDDENGRRYLKDLQDCGIGFEGKLASGKDTGTCLAAITPDAERTMMTSLGAAIELDTQDLSEEALKNTKILYIEGYLWDSPTAREACRKAIKTVKESGGKIAFTFSDSFCVDRHHQDFMDLVKNDLDILFCNEAEAIAAAKTKTAEEALQVFAKTCEKVFISIGPRGALASENFGKKTESVSTWDVKLVDKLGAGDLFAAGALYGLSQNKSLQECAFLGCYSATRVIQQMSARLTDDLSQCFETAIKGPTTKTAAAS